jgi:hypothetical protein
MDGVIKSLEVDGTTYLWRVRDRVACLLVKLYLSTMQFDV